jgi:hypothetical protein
MPLALPSQDPQPLFAVGRHVVRSWNEAHALHGPAGPDDVNPAYVAALTSDHHRADLAPYNRIRRLPRAHHVLITEEGDLHASPYDPLARMTPRPGGQQRQAMGGLDPRPQPLGGLVCRH